LQDELNKNTDELIQKFEAHSQKAKDKAKAAGVGIKAALTGGGVAADGGGKGKGADTAGLIPDMQKKKQGIFTTFSAAALLAGGAGGGDHTTKAVDRLHNTMSKKLDVLTKAVEDGGELDA
jgi:hypothetical protein